MGNIGDNVIDLIYVVFLGFGLCDEHVLQHVVYKPYWNSSHVGHGCSSLKLHFPLGVVKVDIERCRVGYYVTSTKLKTEKETRQTIVLVLSFSEHSTLYGDTIYSITVAC